MFRASYNLRSLINLITPLLWGPLYKIEINYWWHDATVFQLLNSLIKLEKGSLFCRCLLISYFPKPSYPLLYLSPVWGLACLSNTCYQSMTDTRLPEPLFLYSSGLENRSKVNQWHSPQVTSKPAFSSLRLEGLVTEKCDSPPWSFSNRNSFASGNVLCFTSVEK